MLPESMNVLVKGNVIVKISKEPIPVDRSANTKIIDGKGGTPMPGLIDAHAHMAMSTVPLALFLSADIKYSILRQGKAATEMLMRGFTSAHDVGGRRSV